MFEMEIDSSRYNDLELFSSYPFFLLRRIFDSIKTYPASSMLSLLIMTFFGGFRPTR